MHAKRDSVDLKDKVLKGFQEAHPSDLSISEVAARVGVSVSTASTYIKVLVAEGFLEQSRPIGNARLFRVRKSCGNRSDGSDETSGR